MHGFIGCVEPDGAASAAMFRWMEAWLELRPEKSPFVVRDGAFSYLASVEEGTAGARTAGDESGVILVLVGSVVLDPQEAERHAVPQQGSAVAAELLALYKKRGPDALAGLNGRYVICVWHPAEGRVELMNDALGLLPVVIWRGGRGFAFASSVWPIACHPAFSKRVDPMGLVDLLLLSHQQGNRTLFDDVQVLPPGSVTSVRDMKVTHRAVAKIRFSEDRWDWSIRRAAQEMHQFLARSLRRRLAEGSQVLLPLSGGFDSRTMLGLLRECDFGVRAVTQCQPGHFALDTRYARRLARSAGVQHQVVPLADSFLVQYRKKCVAINSGMYDIHTGRYLSLVEQASGKGIPVVSGHLGRELTGGFQIPDIAFSTPQEHYEAAFAVVNAYRFSVDQVCAMLGPELPSDLAEEAVAQNRAFFMSHGGPFYHRHFNWDLLLCRRRYICFQLQYFAQFTQVIAPFYDRDFIDFICSLPFAALDRQEAYRAMIATYFPGLARIPNTNDLPLLMPAREVLRDFAATQYRRFVREPLKRLVRSRRWVGRLEEQLGFALAGQSRPVLEHILENGERFAPYLRPDRVEDAVKRQLAGDNSCATGLLGLSAFVTALEMLEDPYAAIRGCAEERAT